MEIPTLDHGQLTLLGLGSCVALSVVFTIRLLLQHLSNWTNAKEQQAIVVIIFMAPLYAIVSFVGIVDILGSETFFTFLESVKECYEAFVLAKFMSLLYSFLNISISKNIVPDHVKGREIHHTFPVSLFMPHTSRLDHRTLKQLKQWTWQFVVIRPVCSIMMIVLQLLGLYSGWISWVFTMVLNISVSLALYALVVFYHVFAKELAPHRPMAKFLCIKGVVFFCFWQGLAVELLASAGLVRSHHFWLDVEHVEQALLNVLVIVEMVVFAMIQGYAYDVSPYIAKKGKEDKKNK